MDVHAMSDRCHYAVHTLPVHRCAVTLGAAPRSAPACNDIIRAYYWNCFKHRFLKTRLSAYRLRCFCTKAPSYQCTHHFSIATINYSYTLINIIINSCQVKWFWSLLLLFSTFAYRLKVSKLRASAIRSH